MAKITLKQIYRFLLEEVTMVEQADRPSCLKPLKVETASPLLQWERIWQLSRQKMLGPNLSSFLFKLLHQILPTAERTARILPAQSPYCTHCRREEQVVERLKHAIFECRNNQNVGTVLLNGIRKYVPNINPSDILNLNFDVQEELDFPLVWCTASFLSALWNLRTEKKRVELIKIRAEMEAQVRLLRESRLIKTTEMISNIFVTT